MHVLVTADSLSGSWTYTRELVTGLVTRGVRVTLVSFGEIPLPDQTSWMDHLHGLDYRPTAFHLEWMQEAEQDLPESSCIPGCTGSRTTARRSASQPVLLWKSASRYSARGDGSRRFDYLDPCGSQSRPTGRALADVVSQHGRRGPGGRGRSRGAVGLDARPHFRLLRASAARRGDLPGTQSHFLQSLRE